MSAKPTGGLAFPSDIDPRALALGVAQLGMTLRDYFAAQAMRGLLSTVDEFLTPEITNHIAVLSYTAADAMLAEREK